jgi:hypothetical protein
MFLEHKKRGRTPFQPRVIEKRKKKLKKQSTFLRNICKTSSAARTRNVPTSLVKDFMTSF